MTEFGLKSGVDAALASGRSAVDGAIKGANPAPDARFNGAADDNRDDAKKARGRVERTSDAARGAVDQQRNINRTGTAALTGSTTPQQVSRVTTPMGLLGALATPGAGGQSPLMAMAQPMMQFAQTMAQPMAAMAAQAPQVFSQAYSPNPGDNIRLSPQQQQALAAALSAVQEGGPGATTLDGKDLTEGVHGDREKKVVQLAKAVVDAKIPYSWGGGSLSGPTLGISGPGLGANDNQVNGMDCSSFTRYATYQSSGVEIPRVSGAQWAASEPVPAGQARAGDLVFPPNTQGANHVQLYIGNGMIAEQYQSGTTARIIPLDPSYEIRRPRGI